MNSILVTGGAGFIGSNFLRLALAQSDADLIVIDKLTYAGHLSNIQDLLTNPRVRFVQGDIADRSAVEQIFAESRPDMVVNLAAESHVDRSIDSPSPFIEANTVGTFVLLEVARQYWNALSNKYKQVFRFLHVSTDEVYGTLGADGCFSEQSPYAPNSPYAASKAAADHFVRAYFHTYRLPTLITNCSNNFGPYQFPEKLIPLMLLNACDAKPLPIYGDGLHVRDWLYVEDHCEGLWLVLRKGLPGEKYNLGGSNEQSNLNMVNAICRLLEERFPAESNSTLREQGITAYQQLQTFVPDRPGHDRRYAIDSRKIKEELGWTPKFSFESGLRTTIEWYLDHREWCEGVLAENYNRERLGLVGQ